MSYHCKFRIAALSMGLVAAKVFFAAAQTSTVNNAAQTNAPKTDSRIIFCSDDKIFTIRPDGSDRRTLPSRGNLYSPTFSKDGRKYAYSSYVLDRKTDSAVIGSPLVILGNTDGTGKPLVLARSNKVNGYGYPSLSPDGKSVVVSRIPTDEEGDWSYPDRLVTINVDGTRRELGVNTRYAFYPCYSRDGKTILFSDLTTTGIQRISILGGTVFSINIPRHVSHFDFSADGSRIVFTSPEKNDMYGLYVCDADGNRMRRLPLPPAQYKSPAWSPDGRHIAFTYDEGAKPPGLRIVDAEGKNLRILTRDYVASGPFWR